MQADYGYGPLVLAVGEAAKGEFVTRLAGTDSVGAINFGRSDKLSADAQSHRARGRGDRLRHHRESLEGVASAGGAADRGQI